MNKKAQHVGTVVQVVIYNDTNVTCMPAVHMHIYSKLNVCNPSTC